MGILSKAHDAHEEPKKEAQKKKQKKEAEVPSESKPQATQAGEGPPPGESPDESGGDAAPEQDASDQAPDAEGGDAQAPTGDQAGGDTDSPQAPQDAQGQSDSADADQSAPTGDADQSADQDGAPPDADSASGAPTGQAGTPPGHIDLSQIPIPPALKEEYDRCNAALFTALYKNDKVAQAVIGGVVPDGVHKIESVVHMALTVFFQINKQLHFMQNAKQIAMPFMQDVVSHVLDLAMQVKKIQFSEQEQNAALSAAQEMLLRIHGVTKGQMKAVAQHIPRSQLQDALTKYQAHAKASHNITGRFSQDQGGGPQSPGNQASPQGGQPANGGPPPAGGAGAQPGPQGGVGGTPGGQPQPGAPVTAAPGPGQSAAPGGMLSQAANQPPGQ
jgi:hypothetical protein